MPAERACGGANSPLHLLAGGERTSHIRVGVVSLCGGDRSPDRLGWDCLAMPSWPGQQPVRRKHGHDDSHGEWPAIRRG